MLTYRPYWQAASCVRPTQQAVMRPRRKLWLTVWRGATHLNIPFLVLSLKHLLNCYMISCWFIFRDIFRESGTSGTSEVVTVNALLFAYLLTLADLSFYSPVKMPVCSCVCHTLAYALVYYENGVARITKSFLSTPVSAHECGKSLVSRSPDFALVFTTLLYMHCLS